MALLLLGCRFGAPDGDALRLVEPERDAGIDAATMDAEEPAGDGDGNSDDDPGPRAPVDASDMQDADGSSRDGGSDAGDETCEAVILSGCDPVRNEGCTAGVTQCVIDPESSTPVGRCVFTGLPATPCSKSTLTTTCAPQHACIAGACRKYCSCDTDCEAGETCSEPIDGFEASGLRVCSGT